MRYFVYILLCADGSLYTGITTDVARRFAQHRKGTGGRYTRSRAPVKVVFTEAHPNRSSASKREAAIKKLSRAGKRSLITAPAASPQDRKTRNILKGVV